MSNHQVAHSCPARVILFIDVVTFLLAVAILGVSIWAWVQFSVFQAFVTMNTIGIGIGVGIGLFITSCCGMCGSTRGNKVILFCYFLLVALCFTAQVVGAVYVVDYSNIVSSQNKYVSSALTTTTQTDLNNAVLSMYTSCCTGCPNGAGCNQVTPSTSQLLPYCNATIPIDENTTFVGRVCAFAPPCTLTGEDGCYVTPPGASTPPHIPTLVVDTAICNVLASVRYNNTYLVGNAYPQGACGGGLPEVFLHETNGYLSMVFYNLMIVWIFFAVVQGLNLLTTLYVEFCWSPSVAEASSAPPPKHTTSQDVVHT